jgi:diacylglycerol kinase family enzyme
MIRQIWLINTRSGGHRGREVLKTLTGRVHAIALDFSNLSEQFAIAAQFDRIVVVGGDGTFASVLTSPGLPPIPVGLIPLGTANDLAREFGMCRAIRGVPWHKLPALIETLSETPLSVWDLSVDSETRSFCNYCSLGFEGGVVSDFAAWRAKQTRHGVLRNRIAYGLLGAKRLCTRLEGLSIHSNSNDVVLAPSTRGIVITNVKSHMGVGVLTPESDPSDDRIECVNASSPLDYLRMVLSPLGILTPLKSMITGSEITIKGIPSGTQIQVDGEIHAPVREGTIKISFKKVVSILS